MFACVRNAHDGHLWDAVADLFLSYGIRNEASGCAVVCEYLQRVVRVYSVIRQGHYSVCCWQRAAVIGRKGWASRRVHMGAWCSSSFSCSCYTLMCWGDRAAARLSVPWSDTDILAASLSGFDVLGRMSSVTMRWGGNTLQLLKIKSSVPAQAVKINDQIVLS